MTEYKVTKSMQNPAHPGEVLKGLVLKPLGLSIAIAAKALGVDRTTLSRILNCHIAVSVDMAMRLSKAVENTTPQFWLSMQHNYDIAHAHSIKGLSAIKPFSFFTKDAHAE